MSGVWYGGRARFLPWPTKKDRRASLVVRVLDGPDAGRELLVDDAQPHRLFVGRSTASDLVRGGESIRVGGTTLVVEATGSAAPPLSVDHGFGRVLGTMSSSSREATDRGW